MDMLSTLPEHILNQILCSLSQEESVRTCALSKSWRHRGSTRSKLELCDFGLETETETLLSILDSSLQRYHDQNLCLKQLTLEFSTWHGWIELDLPSIASKAEFLQELCVGGDWDLNHTQSTQLPNLSLNHLRKLSLVRVCIADETLEMLLSRCPLIQYLHLDDCKDLRNIRLSKAHNLKHFDCSAGEVFGIQYSSTDHRIEVDTAPVPETVCIFNSPDSHFRHKNFPHLRSICLTSVLLATESFACFTSNYMPSLDELKLNNCYGFEYFRLSNPSIKHLEISHLYKSIKATIDAPNIVHFKSISMNPPSISFTPVSSNQWMSYLDLWLPVKGALSWILELHEVLKALSQSQITLQLLGSGGSQPHIEDTTYSGFYDPLVVECLILSPKFSSSSIPFIFNTLFRVCRPRYIYHGDNLKRNIILWELQERDRKGYDCWNQDFVEVSKQKTRLMLKWRE